MSFQLHNPIMVVADDIRPVDSGPKDQNLTPYCGLKPTLKILQTKGSWLVQPHVFTYQADRRVHTKPFAPRRECLGGNYAKATEVFLWSMSVLTPDSSIGLLGRRSPQEVLYEG